MKEKIEQTLKKSFQTNHVTVEDLTELHANHPEAQKTGGGHYFVVVVSDLFKDKNPITRHRMIYQVLQKEMKTDIHALKIKAYTREEYEVS